MRMGSLELHEELKKELMESPEKLGIKREEIEEISEEVPLRNKKEALVAQPDIMIKKKGGEIIFVEVKSGWHWKTVQSLEEQLKKIKRHLKRKKMYAEILGIYPNEKGKLVMMTG